MKRGYYSFFFGILLFSVCASLKALTYPVVVPLPVYQNFGTASFGVYPSGFVGWKTTNTNATSIGTNTTNDQSIISSPGIQTTAGIFGYNGAVYLQTTGVSDQNNCMQLVLGINTMGAADIRLQYKVSSFGLNSRPTGLLCQYKVGQSGSWKSVGSIQNPFELATSLSLADCSFSLPSEVENKSEVYIRWALLKPLSGSGSFLPVLIDEIVVSSDRTPSLSSIDAVNFGEQLIGSSTTKSIQVKGSNLTSDLTVTVVGAGFSGSTTVSKTDAEATPGKEVAFLFQPTQLGISVGTITISGGGLVEDRVISLVGSSVDARSFLEDFEDVSWGSGTEAQSYAQRVVIDPLGEWSVRAVGVMNKDSDRCNGSRSIRLRGESGDGSRVEMKFSKLNGIGTLSFAYASYGTHDGGIISAYYSINDGANWIKVGEVNPPKWDGAMQKAIFPIYVHGDVRVKIVRDKSYSINSSVNIDDIAITDYRESGASILKLPFNFDFTQLGGSSMDATSIMPVVTTATQPVGFTSIGLNVFAAGSKLRLGDLNLPGSISTNLVDAAGAVSVYVSFDALAWSQSLIEKNTVIKVSYGNQSKSVVLPCKLVWSTGDNVSDWKRFTVEFMAEPTLSSITIESIVSDEANEQRFFINNLSINGMMRLLDDAIWDSSSADWGSVRIEAGRKLTIAEDNRIANLHCVELMVDSEGNNGQMNASFASALQYVSELKIRKSVRSSIKGTVWNAIAVPFARAKVYNQDGEEMTGITDSSTPLDKRTYAGMTYSGESRARNGLSDPTGRNNWVFAMGSDAQLFAVSKEVSDLFFVCDSPTNALAVIKSTGYEKPLVYYRGETDATNHGWNLIVGERLYNGVLNLGSGAAYAQEWNELTGGYVSIADGGSVSAFNPIFVQAFSEGATIQRAFSNKRESGAQDLFLPRFAFELRTGNDQLIDRTYITIGGDREALNQSKMRQGNEPCMWLLKENNGWCALNSTSIGGGEFELRVKNNNTEGTRLQLVEADSNYEVTCNSSSFILGESIEVAANSSIQSIPIVIFSKPTSLGEQAKPSWRAFSSSQTILIGGLLNQSYHVCNLLGHVVQWGHSQGETTSVKVMPGIYFVTVGSSTQKVIVE